MFAQVSKRLSGIFYRAHRFFDQRASTIPALKPYKLRVRPRTGNKNVIHVIGNFIIGGSTQLVVDIVERGSTEFVHKVIVPQLPKIMAYEPVDITAFSISQLRDFRTFLINEKPLFVHIHYFVRDYDRYTADTLWYWAIFDICADLGIDVIQNVNVPTFPYESPCVVHNVFVSRYVRDEFGARSAVPGSVIYPGSDFSHFQNDAPDDLPAKSIGMVYRLDEDKLRKDAIEVFIGVVKKRPIVNCWIVGGGFYFEDFRRRVSEEKMEDNIFFTGYVSYETLPDNYKKFGIFVAPVHDESFGQVTPFAMSMGLAVVGYDTGALKEILGSAKTLTRTGDVDCLVEKIVGLVDDVAERRRIGKANQARAVAKFSVETMIKKYDELYALVCRPKK